MKGPHSTNALPGTCQKVAYTGTAGTISNAFGSQTRLVRVLLSTAGYVVAGITPVATTNDMRMSAEVPEYFACRPGEKISAIQDAAAGTMYVTEMTQ
jgi:hypothetical protein